MEWTEIALDQLRAHPDNSNVMPEHLLAKLVKHIERSGRYPPIIVRPLTDDDEVAAPHYQIIDGHHRVEALRRLHRTTAACVVWSVDDDEALLLMATLNRLEGQDDPRKRAMLLAELTKRNNWKTLAAQLPERSEQLQKLLTLAKPALPPRAPKPVGEMPQAVYFFLNAAERQALEHRLNAIGGAREAALMALVRGA